MGYGVSLFFSLLLLDLESPIEIDDREQKKNIYIYVLNNVQIIWHSLIIGAVKVKMLFPTSLSIYSILLPYFMSYHVLTAVDLQDSNRKSSHPISIRRISNSNDRENGKRKEKSERKQRTK